MKVFWKIMWAIVFLWDLLLFISFCIEDNKTYELMFGISLGLGIPSCLCLWLYCLWQKKNAHVIESELGIEHYEHSGEHFLLYLAFVIGISLAAAAVIAALIWIFWEFKRPFMYCFFFFIPFAILEGHPALRHKKFDKEDITKLPTFENWQKRCQERKYSLMAGMRELV